MSDVKSDIQIAREAKMQPINEVLAKINVPDESTAFSPMGRHIAKINLEQLDTLKDKPEGKLILVTAITPTPAGEGKTTTSVGLNDGLNKIGKKSIVCLREPSLGPSFGMKGGAAGGGYAQVVPMEQINLHFTGDFHAITSAHNLLSALIDNHIYWGNKLDIDVRRIVWKRVMDMNDRSLRSININLGGVANGFPREDGFDLTVASEIMAIFCLSNDWEDLENRINDGGNKQASWRTDPNQSGAGGCIGDIGTHAYNLIRFITDLNTEEISAELTSFVPGRKLDDNAQISIRFKGGAKGTIWSSQVAPGNENHLKIRIYGNKAGLEWCQEDPNYLYFTKFGEPKQKSTRGGSGSMSDAGDVTRIPAGHPEGYLEGFANIYTDVAIALIDQKNGKFNEENHHFPSVEAGLEGIKFIERSIASSSSNSSWVSFN